MIWLILAIFLAIILTLAKIIQIIGEYIDESMEEIGDIDDIDEHEIM
jgi:hypothetical protein